MLADLPLNLTALTWSHTGEDGERSEGGIGKHWLQCGASIVEPAVGANATHFRHVAAELGGPDSCRLVRKRGTWHLARSHVRAFFGGKFTFASWRALKKAAG